MTLLVELPLRDPVALGVEEWLGERVDDWLADAVRDAERDMVCVSD